MHSNRQSPDSVSGDEQYSDVICRCVSVQPNKSIDLCTSSKFIMFVNAAGQVKIRYFQGYPHAAYCSAGVYWEGSWTY